MAERDDLLKGESFKKSGDPYGRIKHLPPKSHGEMAFVQHMIASLDDDEYLDALADRLHAHALEGRAVWCIFDNTARGEATRNMLDLRRRLQRLAARGHCVDRMTLALEKERQRRATARGGIEAGHAYGRRRSKRHSPPPCSRHGASRGSARQAGDGGGAPSARYAPGDARGEAMRLAL